MWQVPINVRYWGNSRHVGMSALPPKADIDRQLWNVCFVPIADIGTMESRLLDHLIGKYEQGRGHR
jgi:hypothetical protein